MQQGERVVGGLRCSEVLADLSDYMDGHLSAARAGKIEAHLRGCDWCERFGGRFKLAVAALRRELGKADDVPREIRARLRDRLRRETDTDPESA